MEKKQQLNEIAKRLDKVLAAYYERKLKITFSLSHESIEIEILDNIQVAASSVIMKSTQIAGFPLVSYNGEHIVLTYHPFLYDE